MKHIPVLLEETMRFLSPASGKRFLDGTAGGGGHAGALLERSGPDGRVVLIDRDGDALRRSEESLAMYRDRIESHQGNFADLPLLLGDGECFDGILLDLGFSSIQLDSGRGFSFMKDEILDMRMDPASGRSAKELINRLSRDELAHIFWTCGEERRSRKIADSIIRAREKNTIETTAQLAAAVRRASDPRYVVKSLARIFQSLRVTVNEELISLERGLPVLLSYLKPGGTFVVITYHSLEDRIVKRFFLSAAGGCVCPEGHRNPWCNDTGEGTRLTKKVVKPTDSEKQANPRSRSAKLRAFRRSGSGSGT